MLHAVEKLTRTSLQFDVLVRVQDQLAQSPAPPGVPAKLVKALDQMSQIYLEIDTAISHYLTLDFEPPTDSEDRRRLRRSMQHLDALATGHTKNELDTLIGHCGEITTIYMRDLKPWFETKLERQDVDSLEELFLTYVAGFDDNIVEAVRELTEWITINAKQTRELVQQQHYREANEHILAADKEIFDARETLLKGINLLRQPKRTFLALA